MPEELFIPPGAIQSSIPSERIALIGPPGSGKTTSLLTFPNLIIGDIDKKAPSNQITIPFWSGDWVKSILKERACTVNGVPNHRDAIKVWFRENHAKFTAEQTFAVDSWSYLMDACDNQTHLEDTICGYSKTKKGERNDFWFWEQKLDFTREIIKYIRSMRCRVIVTFHEVIDRNEDGKPNGKVRPFMTGSYKDIILGAFTNVWRMRPNLPLNEKDKNKIIHPGTEAATGFFWQLDGDSIIDLNTDPNIDQLVMAEGIKRIQIHKDYKTGKVTGGYQTIQELYAKHGMTTPTNGVKQQ